MRLKTSLKKAKNSLKKIENLIFTNENIKFEKKIGSPSKFFHHMKKSDFFKKVNSIKKEISKGEIFQAVLSQRFFINL